MYFYYFYFQNYVTVLSKKCNLFIRFAYHKLMERVQTLWWTQTPWHINIRKNIRRADVVPIIHVNKREREWSKRPRDSKIWSLWAYKRYFVETRHCHRYFLFNSKKTHLRVWLLSHIKPSIFISSILNSDFTTETQSFNLST